MGRLSGKTAVITGAGSGIGRAASLLFAAEGAKLVIADIIKTVGKPSALGSKEVKLRILRKLEEKGVFQLKDSVPQVCELLDISQATLYNYLREIRTQGSGFLPLSQK